MNTRRQRRRGRGAIYPYKTRSGQRWRWQLWEPVNPAEPEGDLQRVSKGGYVTADEADEGLREALGKLKDRVRAVSPKGTTLSTVAADWFAGLEVAPSTEAGYRRLYRLYIEPALGSLPVDAITPSRLRKLYTALRRDGGAGGGPLSANTVRKAHVVLGAILDAAVDDALVPSNAARRHRLVKAPTGKQVRAEAPEMVTWTAAQVTRFLDWDRDIYEDEHFTFWNLLARTGMRRSEALALRWSDIDVRGRRIAVRRAADTIHHGTVKKPKSGTARVVDVDDELLDALRSWKGLRGSISLDFARPEGYVFGNDDGNVINPNRATMRWTVRVNAARRELGEDALPAIPLHGLRHTHATLLLEAGVHPKVVQERLGHSDISITMSVYSHVTESMQRDAVSRLSTLFSGAHGTSESTTPRIQVDTLPRNA